MSVSDRQHIAAMETLHEVIRLQQGEIDRLRAALREGAGDPTARAVGYAVAIERARDEGGWRDVKMTTTSLPTSFAELDDAVRDYVRDTPGLEGRDCYRAVLLRVSDGKELRCSLPVRVDKAANYDAAAAMPYEIVIQHRGMARNWETVDHSPGRRAAFPSLIELGDIAREYVKSHGHEEKSTFRAAVLGVLNGRVLAVSDAFP